MELRADVTRGLAAGAARLVLLVLTAVGFLAMHGVAATDAAGAHHSPVTMPATPMDHPRPIVADAPGLDTPAPTAVASPSVAPADGDQGHGLMAACVFVLVSVLAGVALHAFLSTLRGMPSAPRSSFGAGDQRPRAPPRPIFLSLCVFRL
jgi:hypothetical protein